MMCQVPSGVAPGTVLQLQSPCGQLIHVQVPVGAVPGTVLQVPLTPAIQQPQQQEVKGLHDVQLWKCGQCSTPQKSAPASGCCGCGRVPPAQQAAEDKNIMKIKIRKGMKPGNKIEIKLPDGRKLDACVPDGMVPGDTWKMNIENKTVHSKWVSKGRVGNAKYKILSINNEKVQLIPTPDSEFYSKKDKPFYWYYGTDFKTVGAKGNVQLYDCSVDGKKVNTPSTGSNSVGISFTIKDKKEQCTAIGFKPTSNEKKNSKHTSHTKLMVELLKLLSVA